MGMETESTNEVAIASHRRTIEVLSDATNLAESLGSLPSLVCLESNQEAIQDFPPSLNVPNRSPHTLFTKLEKLDSLQDETNLEQGILCQLTQLVDGRVHFSKAQALDSLANLGAAIPRRVCQHPFRRNDIVWVCRTCQADETCVLCHDCFKGSNHEGHDVAFYHAQAGGCCDCGDPDAWDEAGFCANHGPLTEGSRGLPEIMVDRVRGIVPAAVEWLVSQIVVQAAKSHQRTKLPNADVQVDVNPRQRSFNASVDELNDIDDGIMIDHGFVFLPSAASNSRSRGEGVFRVPSSRNEWTTAEKLGKVGSEEGGLYLIVHGDDIQTTSQWVDALRDVFGGPFYTDALLTRVVKNLRIHGQLVVWGTHELISEMTVAQMQCWQDGDRVASGLIGAALLDRTSRLVRNGIVCSISTRLDLQWEQRAVALLDWLTALARSCDPLCQTVAETITPQHLEPMLKADFQLSARITKAWHSLLLTLLAVPTFKSHLAAAYCDTYQHVTAEYAKGMGVLERSGYTLSVQFLNRVTYVVDLVQHRDLLGKLGRSLRETLAVALGSNGRLDPNHFCLTHRRYSPCISDLKCVLNVKGMARLFASKAGSFLNDWLACLSLAQFMDGQVWREVSQGHVENDPRGWVGAFNASISLGSLFERLLSWNDDDQSPAPDSILSQNTQPAVDLTLYCFAGLVRWQCSEELNYLPTSNSVELDDNSKCPARLPFSTIAVIHGSPLCLNALPVAQTTPWSFHLPLHRFVAACVREVCRRRTNGMEMIFQSLSAISVEELDKLFSSLMEFPLLVLSKAAQVRSGMWRRNGSCMQDQVLNYAEPPFCRSLRDADVLLLQFSAIGRGTSDLVHLLLHRFGLFDFLGFSNAPMANKEMYQQQVESGLYPEEIRELEPVIVYPWTFTAASEVSYCLPLLEEFLHLLIVLLTELPPVPPVDKADHTLQAKERLRREVIHRLASGSKTHSELAEVHHVLSHWDNAFLSEEGREVNPDDASGAALAATLADVAEKRTNRLDMSPDKWELQRSAWEDYDPSFFHMSGRNHQSAAESRPKIPMDPASDYGIEPRCYACRIPRGFHPSFRRLQRDITADASVRSILYRTLHVHMQNSDFTKNLTGVRGTMAYNANARSELALARAVHLLTLGALAWAEADNHNNYDWKLDGGSFAGSIFFGRSEAPTCSDWINLVLLTPPSLVMDSDAYSDEENSLQLLRRIVNGGRKNSELQVQDQALRAGAAWLCEFAVQRSVDAAKEVGIKKERKSETVTEADVESELARRKREAKARAMGQMKSQAARFEAMMKLESKGDDGEDNISSEPSTTQPQSPIDDGETSSVKSTSQASLDSFEFASSPSTKQRSRSSSFASPLVPPGMARSSSIQEKEVPSRLLVNRPHCIICNDDSATTRSRETEMAISRSDDEDGQRKRSRRKSGANALAFVGYTQCSTVLKGGGGLPPVVDDHSPLASVRRFVGIHVALCGHAVHSECCESYLETVLHREDRLVARREEFKCPLCQRLSNCLVPFIDVGADWIDTPYCLPIDENEGDSMMDVDGRKFVANTSSLQTSLHDFLEITPWWIGRDDQSVAWDGQSAFVAAQTPNCDEVVDDTNQTSDIVPSKRRRSVRSLRKKDLYTAWNAMMKTPRFIRRRQLSRASSIVSEEYSGNDVTARELSPSWPSSDDSSAGETVVWKRFMDLISDMGYKADGKRLGEHTFVQYFGEFRHYHVEKAASNVANRAAGKEPSEWPACLSLSSLSDMRRQELSREKILAKLLISIQSFAYSCGAEAFEVKRLLHKERTCGNETNDKSDEIQKILSTYGIADIDCDGAFIVMPGPSIVDDGTQPFNGRLGKLRYFGLALMAATGAVSADLVQLVMGLPFSSESWDAPKAPPKDGDHPFRAPVVFPILLGHVLTHVVAAMCATCGRARARSDFLDLVWPVPFNKKGSFSGVPSDSSSMNAETVTIDCAGFIKLGLLARILQALLGSMQVEPGSNGVRRVQLIKSLNQALQDRPSTEVPDHVRQWMEGCFYLLEAAMIREHRSSIDLSGMGLSGRDLISRFQVACDVAAKVAAAYLSDVGIVFQILVPGALIRHEAKSCFAFGTLHKSDCVSSVNRLLERLELERLHIMLDSTLVRHVVSNWFENACKHSENSEVTEMGDGLCAIAQSRLFQTEGFRVLDWPLASREHGNDDFGGNTIFPEPSSSSSTGSEPKHSSGTQMEVDPFPPLMLPARAGYVRQASGSPAAIVAKKSVELLGGYYEKYTYKGNPHRRLLKLPTSYTDLYAELTRLCPDCEQIALCFICGEVLNANGKGECTRHSFKCGAGASIFFLLQECQGLIMHGGKAAYVQSPYVDSHGETPQFRGRPLNLDLDRYDLFRELWSGHSVRQKVVRERGSSRQVIIADFY